jgi:DNA-binding beta-propeller fold protein YncE
MRRAALFLSLTLSACDRTPHPPAATPVTWLESGVGPGQTVYPRAITRDGKNGRLYIVDRQARIQCLDADGRYLTGWTMPDFHQGKPVGLSVGPDSLLYVPDTHYHRVMVYDHQGREIRRWGKMGNGPGEFIYPTDIAFSGGKVFVAEYGDNDRIQVFTPEGEYLYEFGHFGHDATGFSRPQSILIRDNELFATDACNHRIQVFSLDGKFLRSLGSVGGNPGEFRFPYGLEPDHDGNLIVTEFGNNRVQIVSPAGKSLQIYGSAGKGDGALAFPWAALEDDRHRLIIVDSGNNRLQVIQR